MIRLRLIRMGNLENISVTKRNGTKEPVNLDKIHRVLDWAAEGLDGVSVSLVELRANMQIFDGMTTADIHDTLIKSAADLISESSPDYQYMAARLAMFQIRKKVFGKFTPTSLLQHLKEKTELGWYTEDILSAYSEEDIRYLDSWIKHERDLDFSYAAVNQLESKYLVQNRVTGQLHESPQIAYMLIAMTLLSKKKYRLAKIIEFYDAVSTFNISLPTPIMAGVRTPTKQFSSCVKITVDDSLDSINAGASAIVKYISQRAGIGINAGNIRALGSPIKGGSAFHTGVIPFYKHFQSAVKSCSQGALRGGSATLFYPLWHLEVESLLVLKNNRGVEENRVRQLDYGVQINKLMYERLITDGHITLFSPSEVPGLYDSFFADQAKFEELYVKYENDPAIRKSQVKASELFSQLLQERASTGRIYIQHVDHCNTHSAFDPTVAPVVQSNLCVEITLPTKPMKHIHDTDGEIALCTLAAFNLGAITSLDELEHLAVILVEALDALLDYQDYLLPAAEIGGKHRRALGIGVINLANYFAKNNVKYSDGSANVLTHQTFEAIQYYLLKASMNLSKELGPCKLFNETTYAQGILPIDTYKKDIDDVCNTPLLLDWEGLRADIRTYGLRNSTLTAQMPSETSSQISNATNGIEPPRGFISVKQSKDGIIRQVVPDFKLLKDKYELLWNIPNNKGYLDLVGIMQKFIDQSISANTNYNPVLFEGGRVPMTVLMTDLLSAYKNGVKTLYYHNTRDGSEDSLEAPVVGDDGCEGACKI